MKLKRSESQNSSKQSEVVSDDSSLQEFVLATDHKINQIEVNKVSMSDDKTSEPRFYEVCDESSKKEITEFEVCTPEVSENKAEKTPRESNIADGLKPLIDGN